MDSWVVLWVFILWFAIYDGTRDWANSSGLNHTFRSAIRLAFIILLSFYDFGFDAHYTAGAFKLAVYRFAWFWIVFDLTVNSIQFRWYILQGRVKHLFHIGSTAPLDFIFRLAWSVPMAFTWLSRPELEVFYDRHKKNLIGATVTQYVFKLLLLAITYHWYNFTSETYLF